MSATATNIQLTSLPSTASASPNASNVSPPSTVSNSSSGNQSSAHTTSRPATNTNTNSTATVSDATNNQQSARHLPWRKIRRSIVLSAKTLITIVCAAITYMAFNLAMWSAAKDYRDDCRNQNVTSGRISQSCKEVLYAVLKQPLGLGMFVSKIDQDTRRFIRKDQVPEHSDKKPEGVEDIARLATLSYTTTIVLTIVLTTFLILVMFKRFAVRSGDRTKLTVEINTGEHTHGTETTWVGDSVAKAVSFTTHTSLDTDATDLTDLRRRIVRDQSHILHVARKLDNEWLPANSSTRESETILPSDEDTSGEDAFDEIARPHEPDSLAADDTNGMIIPRDAKDLHDTWNMWFHSGETLRPAKGRMLSSLHLPLDAERADDTPSEEVKDAKYHKASSNMKSKPRSWVGRPPVRPVFKVPWS